jgi:hypothetical protein
MGIGGDGGDRSGVVWLGVWDVWRGRGELKDRSQGHNRRTAAALHSSYIFHRAIGLRPA